MVHGQMPWVCLLVGGGGGGVFKVFVGRHLYIFLRHVAAGQAESHGTISANWRAFRSRSDDKLFPYRLLFLGHRIRTLTRNKIQTAVINILCYHLFSRDFNFANLEKKYFAGLKISRF